MLAIFNSMPLVGRKPKNSHGSILLFSVIYGFVTFSIIVVGISSYAISENRASVKKHNREMAFQVAEAGINYYRWHLAHNSGDFQDGTGVPGPYMHEYKDKDGNIIGRFSLEITPPQTGSTVVTIESTGWLDAQPGSKRVLRARVGFPSLTDYAFLTNTDVWIGDTEVMHGKFHSNGGVRFDGSGDAPITSAVPTYICKSHHGCGNQIKPGIWGTGGPQEYWNFPVPAKDFGSVITANLEVIEDGARENGLYLSSSGKQGWRLEFLASGQVRARKVNTANCYWGADVGSSRYVVYCIDIRSEGSPTTYPMPSNGYIFVNDRVWVDGVVNGRATVGVATGKSIIINSSTVYLTRDGSHVLGLIAERDILVPRNSPDNLVVEAAMLAQNGAAKRYYYPGNIKNSITTYGSVITNGTWTWSWVSGGGSVVSGYRNTNSTYDTNLTYNPPPGFPVGSEYNLITWEEVE